MVGFVSCHWHCQVPIIHPMSRGSQQCCVGIITLSLSAWSVVLVSSCKSLLVTKNEIEGQKMYQQPKRHCLTSLGPLLFALPPHCLPLLSCCLVLIPFWFGLVVALLFSCHFLVGPIPTQGARKNNIQRNILKVS